jgi:hypothetical protein
MEHLARAQAGQGLQKEVIKIRGKNHETAA